MRILLIAAVITCSFSVSGQDKSISRFQSLLNSYYEEYLKLNPSTATTLGDYRFNDRLENSISQSYRDQSRALYTRFLDSVRSFNAQLLSPRDQLSRQIFQYDLQIKLADLQFPDYLTPVNQFRDFRLTFSQLGAGTGNHPFKTVKDYDDFLKRIDVFTGITDTAISNMRKGIAAKRVQPRFVMEKAIPQIKAMIVDTISKSLFYNPIKNLPRDFFHSSRCRPRYGKPGPSVRL